MSTRYSIYLGVLAPLVLGACASQPSRIAGTVEPAVVYANADAQTVDAVRAAASEVDETSAAPEADGVTCRREQKTGSHVRRVVCRTERQRATVRENSQDWLRSGGLQGGPVVAR